MVSPPGWLGEKSGRGFYQRVKKGGESEILTLDPATMEYRPQRRPASPRSMPCAASRKLARTACARCWNRCSRRVSREIRRSNLSGAPLQETCVYAARRVPEISDSIADIDRAMRWGFGWELGPFEVWDTLGVERMAGRLAQEKRELPPMVTRLLSAGQRRASTNPSRAIYLRSTWRRMATRKSASRLASSS